MTWRFVPPRAVRGTQRAVLVTSAVFGLSFMLPSLDLPQFLDYIDNPATPLWMWGAVMLTAALVALVGETVTGDQHPREHRAIWATIWIYQLILVGIFLTLTVATLVDLIGNHVIPYRHYGLFFGSLRRPFLYGLLAHLNMTYVRYPTAWWDSPKEGDPQ